MLSQLIDSEPLYSSCFLIQNLYNGNILVLRVKIIMDLGFSSDPPGTKGLGNSIKWANFRNEDNVPWFTFLPL